MVIKDASPEIIGESTPVPVHFTFKSLVAVAGLFVILWGAFAGVLGMMFFSKSDGEKLTGDFKHHVIAAEVEHKRLTKQDDKAEDARDSIHEALRRIEMRQMQMAPRSIRSRLPAVGDVPGDLPDGTLDP